MQRCTRTEAKEFIEQAATITFLTGAGVSTPSGIPDYRSLQGVYHGLEAPEYLLSRECLQQEPQKFYDFVLQLYHPDAQPNIIHQKMAQLAEKKTVRIVTHFAGTDSPVYFDRLASAREKFCQQSGSQL